VNQINYIDIPYTFITVDVEDWFHILNTNIPPYDQWDDLPSIVEKGTHKILDLLDENNSKATFFVLGWIAEKHPSLIKEIDKRGHEIGCHGYYHKELNKLNDEEISNDILKSKTLLEQIIGKEVIGYRAPGFSSKDYLHLIDILSEMGFSYDASVFPAKRETGGNSQFTSRPFSIESKNKKFYEFPISVYKNRFFRMPIGGGFSRITPLFVQKHLINQTKKKNNNYFMFYFHPREMVGDHPRLHNLKINKYIKTYIGVRNFHKKVREIIKIDKSRTIAEVVNNYEGRLN